MTARGFRVRALGEVAIRCADLAPMVDFYETVIGLDRLSGNASDGIVFFGFGESFGGHTQVLALFAASYEARPGLHPTTADRPVTGGRSALHHIALSLPFGEQDAAIGYFKALGLPCRVEVFDWIGWRGVFTQDPEGNTVELVARDPGWTAPSPA